MQQYSSPWLNFPVPADIITERDKSAAIKDDKLLSSGILLTIEKLRKDANYYKYLPKINSFALNENERNYLGANLSQTENPNFYLTNGTDIGNNLILADFLDTGTIDNFKNDEFPSFRKPLSDFVGSMKILNYVYDVSNKTQMLYWIYKSKIFDEPTNLISERIKETFETKHNWTRFFENDYDITSLKQIMDIDLYERVRARLISGDERDVFDILKNDKYGFFEDINVLTNPALSNTLASQAYATDVRRAFKSNNLVDMIYNTQMVDFINYRFNVVSINTEDFLEIEFSFPQAETAKRLIGNTSFSASETMKVYGKVEL